MNPRSWSPLGVTLAAATLCACGDASPSQPDAGPDPALACGPVVATMTSYPATHEGMTVGGGNRVESVAAQCPHEERSWWGALGDDQTILLTGLAAGTEYLVYLETEEDLAFYVTNACTPASTSGRPATTTTGECVLHVDAGYGIESGTFIAPADGSVYLIIDSPNDDPRFIPTVGAYRVTVALPECRGNDECTDPEAPYCQRFTCIECLTVFDCGDPTAPVCDQEIGSCVAGPAECLEDDLGDPTDDGPAGARTLTSGVAMTAKLCGLPTEEVDWFRIDVAAGEGLEIDVAFTADLDYDLFVFDGQGRPVGLSYWSRPENVTLTYLPAGTYYMRVSNYSDNSVATEYTITATATAAQICDDASDCAAVYSTQVYRGDCENPGAAGSFCQFIPSGSAAAGTPCDSPDDCASELCSYIFFEADAGQSVCTVTCENSTGCAAIPGTTCTSEFQTNFCIPTCADNLDCGVDSLTSETLEPGQPWDYLTCTAGSCGP